MSATAAATTMRRIGSDHRSRSIGADVGWLSGGVSVSHAAEEASKAASGAVREVLEVVDAFDVATADAHAATACQRAARLGTVFPSSALD